MHLSRIRKRRKELGWTQRELAYRTGISQVFLCNIEKGKQVPSIVIALKLAAVLQVSLDWLAGREQYEYRWLCLDCGRWLDCAIDKEYNHLTSVQLTCYVGVKVRIKHYVYQCPGFQAKEDEQHLKDTSPLTGPFAPAGN